MTNKIIIGYQDTPQGHDALALGEVLAETLDARPLAATVPVIATVLPWSRQLMSESELEAASLGDQGAVRRGARPARRPRPRGQGDRQPLAQRRAL